MARKIPYPENWEEIFRQIITKQQSLPEVSRLTGIPVGTLFILVKQYRDKQGKMKEAMERHWKAFDDIYREYTSGQITTEEACAAIGSRGGV